MNVHPERPEWVIRQDFACVWVQAPSASAAVELAAKRLGHTGSWKVGPDVDRRCSRGRVPETREARRLHAVRNHRLAPNLKNHRNRDRDTQSSS